MSGVSSGVVSERTRTPKCDVRFNAKVHVAAWERMTCGTAVNVEFQLLCVTP